jgi:hypothetical protein
MIVFCIDKLVRLLLGTKRFLITVANPSAGNRGSALDPADREAALRRLMEHPEPRPRYNGAGHRS